MQRFVYFLFVIYILVYALFMQTGCKQLILDECTSIIKQIPKCSNDVPNRESFSSNINLYFNMKGSIDEIQKKFLDFFSKENIRAKTDNSMHNKYVITVFIVEGCSSNKKQLNRTSYLITITPSNSNECSDVSVNWLSQSRGIYENNWYCNKYGSNGYQPQYIFTIRSFIKENECNKQNN